MFIFLFYKYLLFEKTHKYYDESIIWIEFHSELSFGIIKIV